MVENDAAYFERRAAEELDAAERATSPQAERAHRDLHRRYTHMATELATNIIPLDQARA